MGGLIVNGRLAEGRPCFWGEFVLDFAARPLEETLLIGSVPVIGFGGVGGSLELGVDAVRLPNGTLWIL